MEHGFKRGSPSGRIQSLDLEAVSSDAVSAFTGPSIIQVRGEADSKLAALPKFGQENVVIIIRNKRPVAADK
jgi:hypothetical protein